MIDRKLTIDVLNYCQVQLAHGVISDGSENLFIHSSVQDRQKLYGLNNFGTWFYEAISSPFILWEFLFGCCWENCF